MAVAPIKRSDHPVTSRTDVLLRDLHDNNSATDHTERYMIEPTNAHTVTGSPPPAVQDSRGSSPHALRRPNLTVHEALISAELYRP